MFCLFLPMWTLKEVLLAVTKDVADRRKKFTGVCWKLHVMDMCFTLAFPCCTAASLERQDRAQSEGARCVVRVK